MTQIQEKSCCLIFRVHIAAFMALGLIPLPNHRIPFLQPCMLTTAWAGSEDPQQSKPKTKKAGDIADTSHEKVSKSVSTIAGWMDSFFDNERKQYEENKTTLRLNLHSYTEKGGSIDFKSRVRMKLVFPKFKKRKEPPLR